MGGGGAVGAPPPLPPGAAGGGGAAAGVAPCKWEVFVKVHSQERFWPKKDFDVQLATLDAKGVIGGIAHTQTIKMVAKDSPDAHFKGSGGVTYGATNTTPKIASEAEWQLAAGKTSKSALDRDRTTVSLKDGQMGKKAVHVDLYIRHPLKVFLQLKIKDPESRLLTFPKDFPVSAYNGKKKVAHGKLDDDGKVDFEVNRKYDWITLKFGDDKKLISNGDGTTLKTELKAWKDRGALEKADAKFFSPPKRWELIEAPWKFSAKPAYVDGTDAYKEAEGKIYLFDAPTTNWVRRIGEKATPVELTLEPQWQFVRLEYFDRYYGHSDHGHKRVNTPSVFLEGFSLKGKEKTREGGAHWTLEPKNIDKSVHCLPWIRQKDDKGAKKEMPDAKSLLHLELPEHSYVVATDKDTRKVQAVKDSDPQLKAGADRLKLYDLPGVWQSAKYYARYSDGKGKLPGKFYESWTDADIQKSWVKTTPLVFSLDDVILSDAKAQPVKLANTDRFAYFYHRFMVAYDQTAADVTDEGVYKPDTGNQEPFYSTVMAEGPGNNYVTDYPNWIRLAAGLGSVWDIFDRRTTRDVKGARAAVRWYDTLAKGTSAANASLGWPGAISKKYFQIQPYFGQKQHAFYQAFTKTGSNVLRYGRFDMVLARCADRIGADEFFLNMQLIRYKLTFNATSAHSGNPGAQKLFMQNSANNIMARWNGKDGVSPGRAELVPQDGVAPNKGEVIHFVQGVPTLAAAHIELVVDNMGGGRASMGSVGGQGHVDDTSDVPTPGFSSNDFTLAHEHGHANSFPDEYSERMSHASHGASGISYNSPGDQFVSDGFFHDLTASLFGAAHAASTAPIAMMAQNNVPRNRYFWQNAEFARKQSGIPFFAKLGGGLPDYKVPGHPNFPQRNYVHWPVKTAINRSRGAHGLFDLLLHAAGKDHYTVNLLPNPPVDAFLAIIIKIDITFPAGVGLSPGQIRNIMRNEILTTNGKFTVSGVAKVQTDAGVKDYTINQGSLRVSPRFIISNTDPTAAYKATYPAQYKSSRATFGVHVAANVVDNAGKVGKAIVAPAWKGKHAFTMAADFTAPTINADLATQTQQFLQEMLGAVFNPVGIQTADLTEIAKVVIKKNANVV